MFTIVNKTYFMAKLLFFNKFVAIFGKKDDFFSSEFVRIKKSYFFSTKLKGEGYKALVAGLLKKGVAYPNVMTQKMIRIHKDPDLQHWWCLQVQLLHVAEQRAVHHDHGYEHPLGQHGSRQVRPQTSKRTNTRIVIQYIFLLNWSHNYVFVVYTATIVALDMGCGRNFSLW